eukprot:TRINITY_DN104148_c0_g1_i1.p1 TRINITY_DN104148_c0_g1~~TRINITY_DN104148_c0_g1_i1.p1  ORF type:complete len:800 (+),score=38.93 TRINITY_DN104148_c0_g1_i1:65-2464(+)
MFHTAITLVVLFVATAHAAIMEGNARPDAEHISSCHVTDWSPWGGCSKTCGLGTVARVRHIIIPAFDCGPTIQTTDCNLGVCPKPGDTCNVGQWSEWGPCSESCDGGVQRRLRFVTDAPLPNGVVCPATVQSQTCNTIKCSKPVVCTWSSWTEWTTCSKTCQGQQKRVRHIVTPGKNCTGSSSQTKWCDAPGAACHCDVAPWTMWSKCSEPCGGGSRTRTRAFVGARNPSMECPATKQTADCNTNPCTWKVDCQVGEWSKWGLCNRGCGGGAQVRVRTITRSAENGGAPCPDTTDMQACNTQNCCDFSCVVSMWSDWSDCSASCGGGTKTRSRRPKNQGAKNCPPLTSSIECNTQSCTDTDCVVAKWSDWSPCSRMCAGGMQMKFRTITTQPRGNGKPCPATSQAQRCNMQPCCRSDCVVGQWTDWSSCSKSCGSGTSIRTRPVLRVTGHRPNCPSIKESQDCNTMPCDLTVDCVVSGWSKWDQCTVSCGGGTHTQTRTITIAPKNGGKACPSLVNTEPCNTDICPAVDCPLGQWSKWSTCTKVCGSGKSYRTRKFSTAPKPGANCPSTQQTQDCNTQVCDGLRGPCTVSPWNAWTACSCDKDGKGAQSRVRLIEVLGARCPQTKQVQACSPCVTPKQCPMGEWSAWGACSKLCGAGTQTRSRKLTGTPATGVKCGATTETQDCNTHTCDGRGGSCKIAQWTNWNPCTKTCGGGTHKKTRQIIISGDNCPTTEITEPCNTQPCDSQNCALSQWSSWGKCSVICGPGHQSRSRVIVARQTGDGKPCPATSESRPCNPGDC